MKEAYPENGRFFLPKNPNKIDSAQLTYHAIQTINVFNEIAPDNKVMGLKKKAIIDYFMTKVIAASDSDNLALANMAIKAI